MRRVVLFNGLLPGSLYLNGKPWGRQAEPNQGEGVQVGWFFRLALGCLEKGVNLGRVFPLGPGGKGAKLRDGCTSQRRKWLRSH